MKSSDSNSIIITRLTALWALTESALGGVMHALHIPFTGIFVGGMAVICISLIALNTDSVFREVMKSTLLVLMVKAGVSPHTPVPAYIAVTFQGFLGALFFSVIRNFRVASLLFGFMAITESAIQKFLFTTLIFGKSVWVALDIFMNSVLKDFGLPVGFSFSFWIVSTYVILYALFGVLLGIFIGEMPFALEKISKEKIHFQKKEKADTVIQGKKRGVIFLLVILFVFLVFLMEGKMNQAFYVLLRSLAVTLLLFIVVRPLIVLLIRFTGKNKKEEMSIVLNLLPELRSYIRPAYELSFHSYKGIKKYKYFVLFLIHFTISDKTDD